MPDEKKTIDEYRDDFPTWTSWLLSKEFSIIVRSPPSSELSKHFQLNGIGSSTHKHQILKMFAREALDGCNTIFFDGRSSLVTANSILSTINTEFKLGVCLSGLC